MSKGGSPKSETENTVFRQDITADILLFLHPKSLIHFCVPEHAEKNSNMPDNWHGTPV